MDYSPAVVKEWRTLGIFTNIVAGDVEKLGELRLRGPFDVVVAGDIIEHLSNPGMMLDGVRALCTAESSLIITTPNAFGLPNYGRFLLVYRRERTRPHIQQRHIVESTETPWIQNRKCGHLLQPLSVARRGLLFRLGRFVLERVPRLGGTLLLRAMHLPVVWVSSELVDVPRHLAVALSRGHAPRVFPKTETNTLVAE